MTRIEKTRRPCPVPRPLTVVVLGFLLATSGCNRERPGPKPEDEPGVGEALTYLTLRPLTGPSSPVGLSDLKGHVVLLNIWGTWCPPCRAELPHMAELRQRFAAQTAFRLLAVSYPSIDQNDDVKSLREETADLLKRLNLDLPTYYDPEGKTLDTIKAIPDFAGFPTTLLLDRRGVIRAIWKGYIPGLETEMERYIAMILAEKQAEKR